MASATNFISVQELPEKYRNIFPKYRSFNRIQSRVYPRIFESDNSIVVSAPTSAGKTAIFELAIVKCLINNETKHDKTCKIVMVAPMKAICNERLHDWRTRFSYLNINIFLLTGTTETSNIELNSVDIIITTPEKWDSIMRQWNTYKDTLQKIQLFMIDELQLVGDNSRGPTLEAIVSRMKTMNISSGQLRIVGVTAVIPNLEDVATWLGKNGPQCEYFSFGEETRPVPLKKIVLSFPPSKNYFTFDLSLNYKLAGVILEHAAGKPSLVFCCTRNGVETSGKEIVKRLTARLSIESRQQLLELSGRINHPTAKDLIKHGIGIHHAGISESDLQLIEDAFRAEKLMVLVTTTTLSMGVNLPAHLVIIKGTRMFSNGDFHSYTEAQMQQMIGRAGRPQFDTSAVAVIMTTHADKKTYETMLNGSVPLESNLHLRLIEHLNSEIALGTMNDLAACMHWLTTTYLYVRAERNPRHYGMPVGLGPEQMERKLTQLYQIDINKLVSGGMTLIDENASLSSTFLGELMARHYLQFETVKNFNLIEGTESTCELLQIIVRSKEYKDIFLRVSEKRTLNALNSNKQEAIRFPMAGKIKTVDMKINCLIQAVLGCLPINESGLTIEADKIVKSADAILKCLTEHLLKSTDKFAALYSAQILSKSVKAKLWENSKFVARQLPGVGTNRARMLANNGKNTFDSLARAGPNQLNIILRTNIGERVTQLSTHIPNYEMELKIKPRSVSNSDISRAKLELIVQLTNVNDLFPSTVDPSSHMQLLVGNLTTNELLLQNRYTHNFMIESGSIRREISVMVYPALEQITIGAYFISTNWVGFDASSEITIHSTQPNLPPQIRQKPKTTLTDYFQIRAKQPSITGTKQRKQISPPDITPIITQEITPKKQTNIPAKNPENYNFPSNTTTNNNTNNMEIAECSNQEPVGNKRRKKNIQLSDIYNFTIDNNPTTDNLEENISNTTNPTGKTNFNEDTEEENVDDFDDEFLKEWLKISDNKEEEKENINNNTNNVMDELSDSFEDYLPYFDENKCDTMCQENQILPRLENCFEKSQIIVRSQEHLEKQPIEILGKISRLKKIDENLQNLSKIQNIYKHSKDNQFKTFKFGRKYTTHESSQHLNLMNFSENFPEQNQKKFEENQEKQFSQTPVIQISEIKIKENQLQNLKDKPLQKLNTQKSNIEHFEENKIINKNINKQQSQSIPTKIGGKPFELFNINHPQATAKKQQVQQENQTTINDNNQSKTMKRFSSTDFSKWCKKFESKPKKSYCNLDEPNETITSITNRPTTSKQYNTNTSTKQTKNNNLNQEDIDMLNNYTEFSLPLDKSRNYTNTTKNREDITQYSEVKSILDVDLHKRNIDKVDDNDSFIKWCEKFEKKHKSSNIIPEECQNLRERQPEKEGNKKTGEQEIFWENQGAIPKRLIDDNDMYLSRNYYQNRDTPQKLGGNQVENRELLGSLENLKNFENVKNLKNLKHFENMKDYQGILQEEDNVTQSQQLTPLFEDNDDNEYLRRNCQFLDQLDSTFDYSRQYQHNLRKNQGNIRENQDNFVLNTNPDQFESNQNEFNDNQFDTYQFENFLTQSNCTRNDKLEENYINADVRTYATPMSSLFTPLYQPQQNPQQELLYNSSESGYQTNRDKMKSETDSNIFNNWERNTQNMQNWEKSCFNINPIEEINQIKHQSNQFNQRFNRTQYNPMMPCSSKQYLYHNQFPESLAGVNVNVSEPSCGNYGAGDMRQRRLQRQQRLQREQEDYRNQFATSCGNSGMSAQPRHQVSSEYGKLPLSRSENWGQNRLCLYHPGIEGGDCKEKPPSPRKFAKTQKPKRKITLTETTTQKVKLTIDGGNSSMSIINDRVRKTKKSLAWKTPLVTEREMSPIHFEFSDNN